MSKLSINEAFCKLLLHNKLITEEQAQENLALAARLRDLGVTVPFSDLLVERKVIAPQAAAAVRKLVEEKIHARLPESPVRALGPTAAEDAKIGNLLQHNGLVSDADLEAALAAQEELSRDGVRLMLGEILVGRGFVQLPIMESVLELQRAISRGPAGTVHVGTLPLKQQDLQFGALAIGNGLATREQVQAALVLQRELAAELGFPQRLGAVLLAQGVMTEEGVRSVLELQAAARAEGKSRDPQDLEIFLLPPEATEERLGELLEKHQLVPQLAIQQCLEIQQKMEGLGLRRRLGELLLMRGALAPEKLEPLLKVQKVTQKKRREEVEEKVRKSVRSRGDRAGAKKQGLPGWVWPAAAGGVIAVAALGYLVLGGSRAPQDQGARDKGQPVAKAGDGEKPGEQKPPGGQKPEPGAPDDSAHLADPRWRALKDELARIEAEMEMAPPLAMQILGRAKDQAAKLGFAGLAHRAGKLQGQLQGLMQAYLETEFSQRAETIDGLLANDRLLDALGVFSDLEHYFSQRLTDKLKPRLAALRERVTRLERDAVAGLRTEVDGALAAAEWDKAKKAMERLSNFGPAGEKLAAGYEKTLTEKKKAHLQAQLAASRQGRLDEGRARLKQAQEGLALRRTAAAELLAERTRLARQRTAGEPIPELELRGGERLRACRITAVEEGGIKIEGQRGGKPVADLTVEWARMEPRSRVRVTPLTLTESDPAGHIALGKLCIVHGLYDEAEAAFRKAVALDGSLAGKLPSVADFRAPVTVASGKVTRTGDRLQVAYAFDKKEELEDFGKEGEELKIEGGQLVFGARRLVRPEMLALKAPLSIEVVPGQVPPGGYLVLQVSWAAAGEQSGIYLLLNDSRDRYAVGESAMGYLEALLRVATGTVELKHCRKNQSVRFLADPDKVSLLIGEDSVFTKNVRIRELKYYFIGTSRNPEARFGLEQVTLAGRLGEEQYRRAIEEKRSWKLRALDAEDLAGGGGEDEETSSPELPKIAPEHEQALSPSEAQIYKELLSDIEIFMRQPDTTGKYRVEQSLERLQQKNSRCPALYFWRGWYRTRLGEFHAAALDLDRAVEYEPRFPEALAHKAQVLMLTDRERLARDCAARALELQPDYTYALALLAYLNFYERKSAADGLRAIESLEIAALLDPADASLRRMASRLSRVLKGPPWPRGAPAPQESEHFALHTDLPPAEASHLLQQMELIRKEFVVFLPALAQRPGEKAVAFVFANRATYTTYHELTVGGESHNTLGYYLPLSRHLHLFKDPEDTGTRSVAATLNTLRHEAFHQYIHGVTPGLPRWLNEGLAEHFGSATIEPGGARYGVQKGRLRNLLDYMKEEQPLGLREFMNLSPGQFMRYDMGYPQTWSIVYLWLMHQPRKYREPLMRYLERLRKGDPSESSFQDTLGRLDFDQMQRDWKEMIEHLAKTVKFD